MTDTLVQRAEFEPPPPGGMRRALAWAVLAHVLLILALTWGLRWKTDSDDSVEAELWAASAQHAAPAPRPATPTPPPVPVPAPPPPPPPVATPKPPPPPPQKVVDESARDAEIALAQKKKVEEQKRQAALQEQQRQAKLEKEREEKLEQERERKQAALKKAADDKKAAEAKKLAEQKQHGAEQRKQAAEKQAAEKKAADEAKRKEAAAKAAADKKAQDKAQAERDAAEKKAEAARDAKAADARRKAELDRLARLAGTGDSASSGTGRTPGGAAAHDAGPSAGYAAKVRARVKPNITFTDDITGNPSAEVEVRTSPDGTIVGKRLVKSSGVKAWDDAVLRAIDKTETMPRDIDGRVPTPMIIEFRPRG